MAQGINKAIELKGIARNTAGSTCPDGELEEIINLRYRDGSWKPCGEMSVVGNAKGYTDLYVHTNSYHHLLGVSGGKLWWVGNIVDKKLESITPIEICDISGSAKITQNGHLLTIVEDGKGIQYSLFNTQKDEYVTLNADFNGKQTDESLIPEGLIDFRVTAVVDDLGRPLYAGITEPMSFDYITNNDSINQDNVNKIGRQMESIVDKLYSMANQTKYFAEGYMMLCYALELYDGSYILQSRPILLGSPYINKEEFTKYIVGTVALNESEQKYLKPNLDVCDEAFRSYLYGNLPDVGTGIEFDEIIENSFGSSISIDILDCINGNGGVQGYNGVDLDKTIPINKTKDARDEVKSFESAKYADIYTIKNGSSNSRIYALNVKPFRPLILNAIVAGGDFNVNEVGVAYTAFNKLQIKTNKQISSTYKDIIKGISIFITDPVRPFTFDYSANFKVGYCTSGQGASNYDPFGTYDIYPVYKNKADIIKELSNKTSFYKIKDIKLEEFKTNGEWFDIELEEGILSVLTENERLQVSSFGRNSYLPKISFSYNGRLHIANYTEEMFHGFPLKYFFAHESEGQWEVTSYDKNYLINDKPFAQVVVTIETDEGETKVVRYVKELKVGEKWYDLNPIISYPDTRAKSIQIIINNPINDNGDCVICNRTFELTPHPYFNFAYYISPDLKPIDISTNMGISNGIDLVTEQNTQTEYSNRVKVSSTDNPLYFPFENTYQIGNSEIVGFATNTIAVSTGQVGDAPLYVFAKDGIYALFVDASGQLTYTNSRPISRDVCNNPRSITPIDDGVLFTTDRGLMLLQGSEVIDMSDIVEGTPFDCDSVSEIKACINHSQLVKLGGSTSKDNFLTYIKGAQIGYNYFDKEIWVTNPNYQYSYVYNTKVQGWSKRTEIAKELVSDYPYLYMFDDQDNLLNIAEEKVELTDTMFLTRPIKLQTQEFKQTYRTILRCLLDNTPNKIIDTSAYFGAEDIVDIVYGDYIKFINEGKEYVFVYTGNDKPTIQELEHNVGEYTKQCYCGLYLFGSYDCRKWALIGAREQDGTMRDLGLLSHRVDCKFFRLLFVSKLKEGSSIEYGEMTVEARLLADKIR